MKSRIHKNFLRLSLVIFFACALKISGLQAASNHPVEGGVAADQASGAQKGEDIAKVIIHHVMDSHDWEFFEVGETHVAIPLPWIIYNSDKGLQFFMNTQALDEAPEYVVSHDKVHYVGGKASVSHEEAEAHPEQYFVDHESGEVFAVNAAATVLDFSMTKTALQILIVAILMLLLFTRVAKAYKTREGMAPKGLQSFMEPLILFVREDVAKPYLHGKHDKFVPYLLTLFFFIWISNLFGLTPLSSNIAGNTTITIMLAMITLILIVANSTKDFWMHILWFPGVPIWMKPLMLVVELMGFFTKPAALAIRLFANISAGHFMVLSLISLIFILGKNGESVAGALGIMPLSIAFSLFIFAVELIVAAVQAFVFALLTAVFIGQAMETHGHDAHAEEAAHH
jgi:F-type H+-transporting ATPase subunit a